MPINLLRHVGPPDRVEGVLHVDGQRKELVVLTQKNLQGVDRGF